MGTDSVDLAARTGGLLPAWLFLLLVAIWVLTMLNAWRRHESCPERLSQNLAIGSLFLANALFFWRPLFTGAHLPRGGGDLNSFFFTLHAYSAERVTSGEIPLWNPTLHGGMPHLGNFQAGILYPPNLLAYLLAQPFSYGTLEWLAILHYLIASLGVYLLLRALGAGRIGAVAGGLIFAYGGFFVAHLGHYSMISAAAWMPWLFWASHRLVSMRSLWTGAGLALLVFLAASAGHQQTLLFALGGAGAWWLFLLLSDAGVRIPGIGRQSGISSDPGDEGWRRLWHRRVAVSVGQFGVAVGTGLLLAAPMILPSLQLAQRSVRSTLSFEQASEFSVQPVALLQLILPTVFGSNPTDYWGAFSSGEIWGYVGVTTLVVAAIGLILRPDGHRLFFAGLAILSLLYAVGPAAPVHGWFFQFVPGFDLVRAPARSYLYLNLALATLAGFAVSDLSRYVQHPGLRWQRVLDRTIRGVLIAIGAIGLIIIPYFYTRILGVNDPPNRPVITVDNLWMMLIFLSLLLVTLWLARRQMLRGAALGGVLLAVMVLDLFSATMPFNPTEEDLVASYRQPELATFLTNEWDPDAPFRVDVRHAGLLPNFGAIDGLQLASGVFDPMQPEAYTTLINVLSERPSSDAYAMMNVRYWVLPQDEEPPGGFELVLEGGEEMNIWERTDVLPRAWFVSNAIDTAYDDQLDHLRGDEIDPADSVLIESPDEGVDGTASGDVVIMDYAAEQIALSVEVDGPGYVVITDGDYPGWVAEIDGERVPVETANHGLRAIPVDQTTRQVVLSYQPGFVTLGVIAAGLGCLLLIGLLAGPLIMARIPSEYLDRW